jgi:hypothetical protein
LDDPVLLTEVAHDGVLGGAVVPERQVALPPVPAHRELGFGAVGVEEGDVG